MSCFQPNVMIAALTRSGMRRDQLGVTGTDEELLLRLNARLDSHRIGLLATTSKLLRLMHALLSGAETGEGFMEKFPALWGPLKVKYSRDLQAKLDKVDQFYSDIQLFCASANDRREEPLLFGIDRLKGLAEPVYAELEHWWCDCVSR
jgi:hypothetical protein